jgi:hypothetical protein
MGRVPWQTLRRARISIAFFAEDMRRYQQRAVYHETFSDGSSVGVARRARVDR